MLRLVEGSCEWGKNLIYFFFWQKYVRRKKCMHLDRLVLYFSASTIIHLGAGDINVEKAELIEDKL